MNQQTNTMNIDPNAPAFPWEDAQETTGLPRPHPGLTIRQHFAAMAMQGMVGSDEYTGSEWATRLAKHSVEAADALIAALNKEGK